MNARHLWRMALALVLTWGAPMLAAQPASPPPRDSRPVTAADVRFVQDMIGHHQQAVDMAALLKTRTHRSEMITLGARISISQADEIDFMRRWIARHGVGGPAGVAHAIAGHHGTVAEADHHMPGMLSAAQMAALRKASGLNFDVLFLRGMIQHHEGALAMVRALMETPDAAQESALNRFVIDVSADQRAEISRMRRLVARK